jgi:hypothetical protein
MILRTGQDFQDKSGELWNIMSRDNWQTITMYSRNGARKDLSRSEFDKQVNSGWLRYRGGSR